MGATLTKDMTFGANVKLLVEWISITEFGPLQKVDIYIGVHTSQNVSLIDAQK